MAMSTTRRQAIFWTAAALGLVVFLYLFKAILLPFIMGMAVAYFLDPVADWFERRGAGRAVATTLVLALFFLAGIAVLLVAAPIVQNQLVGVFQRLPALIDTLRTELLPALDRLSAKLDPKDLERAESAVKSLSEGSVQWILSLVSGIVTSGLALFNLLGLIVITPVVSWYLLRDWDVLVARVDSWLPRAHAEVIREQVRKIDRTLAGFVRGQATVCLILGTGYAVALELVGLEYGLVVGLFAGLISFIPYVGSITGLILSAGLAYVQADFSPLLLGVVVIFFAGQAIEGNYLTPKLVGDRVGLHAVWVMFALLAGGAVFGFVGVMIAVPVAAVIGVLSRFLLDRYLDSHYYTGKDDGPGRDDGTAAGDHG